MTDTQPQNYGKAAERFNKEAAFGRAVLLIIEKFRQPMGHAGHTDDVIGFTGLTLDFFGEVIAARQAHGFPKAGLEEK